MLFRDRAEAARQLARRLHAYGGTNPLILAIPRGAVPMGAIIADILEGELDVVLVHKLSAPGLPELAVGAIDEKGNVYLVNSWTQLGFRSADLEKEKGIQLEVLRDKRRVFGQGRALMDANERIAIIVDDGIATGSTMVAAVRSVRAMKPKKLVVAVPVASPEALRKILAEADEVVCLHAPAFFRAVGEFFEDFSQVSDEDVANTLERTRRRFAGRG